VLITRTRKLAFESSAGVHVRPHVFVALPSVRVDMVVLRVDVACAAVHEAPPFQDSCTHMRGEPDVLSTRASSRTSMPRTVAPEGREIP
jgi:hypothetical protein